MALTGAFRPRALVHSAGSAARIARLPIDFVLGDLCDRKCIEEAVKGCDMIVNLARGTDQVLTNGLENVLRAGSRYGIQRFVHVSSVAVYGDHPAPASRTEQATPKPGANLYGRDKLAQEMRVRRYASRRRMPTVILRPPNIYGPFSHFTVGLINRLRKGTLPLVDSGRNPCNLVYVDNLIEAILLALISPAAVQESFFVTDREEVTWQQCLEDHAALVGAPLPRVATSELVSPRRSSKLLDSLRITPRVLVSGELRAVLRQIPLVESVEKFLWNRFDNLGPALKQRIRARLQGPRFVAQEITGGRKFELSDSLVLAQGRTVAHSCEKACRLLGYTAPVSYQEGMKLTAAWLRSARIITESEESDLETSQLTTAVDAESADSLAQSYQ